MTANDAKHAAILADKHCGSPSAFTPESLLQRLLPPLKSGQLDRPLRD